MSLNHRQYIPVCTCVHTSTYRYVPSLPKTMKDFFIWTFDCGKWCSGKCILWCTRITVMPQSIKNLHVLQVEMVHTRYIPVCTCIFVTISYQYVPGTYKVHTSTYKYVQNLLICYASMTQQIMQWILLESAETKRLKKLKNERYLFIFTWTAFSLKCILSAPTTVC